MGILKIGTLLMPIVMLRITVQELEAKGIQYQQTGQIHLFGKCFVHEQSYAKADSDVAMEYCRNELGQNRVCVLIVEPEQDSVWREISEVENTAVTASIPPEPGEQSSGQGQSSDAIPSPSPTIESAIDFKSLLNKLNEPIDLKALLFKKLL
jgi:hypothetical protein